jgi:hypothetical protein
VVGRVEIAQPLGDIGFIRRLAVLPDRHAVEIGLRDQAGGVLAGIEAGAGWIAVGVDDVAVEGGAHRRDAVEQAVIEIMDVPVGVGQQLAVVVQPVPDGRRARRCRCVGNRG